MANAAEIVVFAAGSLRAPLTDIARVFERESGDTVILTFGASGLLRDRIEKKERADVFASANMEHPQSLAATDWTSHVARFARNRMCILALPSVKVTSETVLATMLDPGIRLGTSTPKADPFGRLRMGSISKGRFAKARGVRGLVRESVAIDRWTAIAAAARDLPAVRNKRLYVVPDVPFGWFDAPPSLNRLLGVQWLVRVLHPKLFPEPLGPRIAAFHRLYYHRGPTETQVRALLETAGLSR
ncbi:MAG TPA: substrate-binding domain-containing protein [Casimicrobiaceae bacterium]|jgi:hypothetical protein